MRRLLFGTLTHAIALAIGFALGIYILPILTAPPSPDAAALQQAAQGAIYRAQISEDLPGNDALHWGQGTISLARDKIVHEGRLAPGPDYRVYLVPEFVEDEAGFETMKASSRAIGAVKSFNGFTLDIPADVNIDQYTTVLIWCEAFDEFIAAARYR